MNRTGTVLAAVLTAALAVAGCGSSSSSSSAPSITKAQFVAKANAICVAGNAVTTKAAMKLGSNPSAAQILAYTKGTLIPTIQGQINAIKALGAPKGDEATVSSFLALAQADLNKLKANPSLIIKGGPTLFHDFALKAHAYGLTKCAASD